MVGSVFMVLALCFRYKAGAKHGDHIVVRTIPKLESDYRIAFDQEISRVCKSGNEGVAPVEHVLVSGTIGLVALDADGRLVRLPVDLAVELRQRFS